MINGLKTKIFIGILGGSCSGKTALAKILAKRIGLDDTLILSEDDYYFDTTLVPNIDFDNPSSRDYKSLLKHINLLKIGQGFEKPIYDFIGHSALKKFEQIIPKKYCIIEGTHCFYNEQLRDIFNLKIFIDTDDDIRFNRRIKRDVFERGRTKASIVKAYKNVRIGYDKWTLPNKLYADIIIDNNDDNAFNDKVINEIWQKIPKFESE